MIVNRIKYGGYGTSIADYYTIKVGNKQFGKSDGFIIKYKFDLSGAENFANELKLTEHGTITIVGHKDPKKARAEAKSRLWEGKKYRIEVFRYGGVPTSVSLWRRDGGGLVKQVSVYDIGYLFQYDINKRQMDFLDKIKKEAGVK